MPRWEENRQMILKLLSFFGIAVGNPLFIEVPANSEKYIIKYIRKNGVGKKCL